MKTYKKPVVTVDAGMAEGVYAASGASQGTLNVTYHGVWDRWGTNGGKGLAQADWSGKTATLTFASTASNPLTIGIHLNHGTSIDELKMTGFTYSVN